MESLITEVQITFIVLTDLMTLILAFSLPRHGSVGKTTEYARKLLTIGTALITIHFIIQYTQHKFSLPLPEIRTAINQLFGIPTSFCFNMSTLYIQRQGNIRKHEWLIIPILYALAVLTILIASTVLYSTTSIHTAIIINAVFYTTSLVFSNILEIKEYFRIRTAIKNQDFTLESFNKWTQWSLLIIILAGIGMPYMTFNKNLFYRSMYGIFSIAATFFFIFSFIGYYLNGNSIRIPSTGKKSEKSNDERNHLNEAKTKRIESAIQELIQSKFYLQAGITLKDVADQLGISRNTFNAYLQQTEYKKFNNWLMQLRLEEAKKMLLAHPDWSNETIAHECGFSNRAYFQSQFSEHVGMSPFEMD